MKNKRKYIYVRAIEKWIKKKKDNIGGRDSLEKEIALLDELLAFIQKYEETEITPKTEEVIISELKSEISIRTSSPLYEQSRPERYFVYGLKMALLIFKTCFRE